MDATTRAANIFLSLLLSIILTFILTIVYALFPFISAIYVSLSSRRAGTGGIGVVAGGLSGPSLLAALVGAGLFLVIFFLLERRRTKNF